MLVRVRMAAAARVAAVLVAVTLSGAPRAVAMLAPVEAHRCTCRAHGSAHHQCDCATCRRSALAAQEDHAKAPPCHRTAAHQALSRSAPAGSRSAPCVEGTCGGADRPMTTSAGVEPFCLPTARLAVVADREEPRTPAFQAIRNRSLEPETPPPRES